MKRGVAQLFVWGFEGTRVTRPLKRLLREFPPAGLILFRRNIENPRQLRNLIAELQALAEQPLLIGIDQEGGRVSRLPAPWTQYPPASTWGQLYQRLGPKAGKNLLVRIGRFMGRELSAVGINLNFAPVLDVNSNPHHPIIGDRAFSSHPEVVIRTAIPFAQGLLEGGILPCGKHFPGHGGTRTDSHLVLPRLSQSASQLNKIELPPFRAAIKLPALMTAHVVYPALDPKNPATLSRVILEKLLRRQLGFKGVLFSDDLQMKAMQASLSESVCLAFEAGVDLLLICKNFEKNGSVVEALSRHLERDQSLQTRLKQSLQRIDRLKAKIPKLRP